MTIDFDKLTADHPEYAKVWPPLREWFRASDEMQRSGSYYRSGYVGLATLCTCLDDRVEKLDLVMALNTMVDEGMLRVVYRVRCSNGFHVLSDEEYAEPDLIPNHLLTPDCDLVAGFRWEMAKAELS